jgi:hypothetical protein
MLAGGILQNRNAKPAVAAVELYEPRSNRWSAAARMHARRVGATSVLLRDGRVLVAGGGDGTGRLNTTAEVYDPGTDSWAFVAPMPIGTAAGGAPGLFSSVLDSGKVLVVGGRSEERYATSSVFDPATDTWMETEVVSGTDYLDHLSAATQLRDGRVLAITSCGYSGGKGKTAIYGALGWAAAERPPFCASGPSALSALPSGRALLASTRRAAIYDPTADRWTIAPPYRFPYGHVYGYSPMRVVPAPGGAVLVSEGLNPLSSAERFFDR